MEEEIKDLSKKLDSLQRGLSGGDKLLDKEDKWWLGAMLLFPLGCGVLFASWRIGVGLLILLASLHLAVAAIGVYMKKDEKKKDE